jgi:hypothetical protein
MRKNYSVNPAKILCGILLILSSVAKGQSSMGKTFWMTFMESIGSPDTIQELKIVIASEKATSGTVRNYISNKTVSFSIGSGGGTDTVLLPASLCYTTGSESSSTKNKGILIQSNDEVSVSAQNNKAGSNEASLIYSIESTGTYYRILSHMGDQSGNNSSYRSSFAIVATEDNTIIDITPSVATAKGNQADSLFTITLHKGETYQVQSSTHRNDLSGTLVQSRNCKKIAVFAGSLRSSVLNGSCTPSYSHLYEQMVPVIYWAKRFIAMPSIYTKGKQRKAEMIKIVASLNSTTVRVNGKLKVINAGRSDTFFITTEAVIIANKPIGVCQYALSEGCDPGSTNTAPYMMWVPSVEQAVDSVFFASEHALSVNNVILHVVVKTVDTKNFRLNGMLHNPGWSKVLNDTNFSYTRMDSLTKGKHRISCSGGIMSTLYAYGNHGSYGFMNAAFIDSTDFHAVVNGKSSDKMPPGSMMANVCTGNNASFDANVLNSGNVTWKWIIHDSLGEVVRSTESFSYKFNYPGVFKVSLIAQKPTPGLCNGQTSVDDTMHFRINVVPKPDFDLLPFKNKICWDSSVIVYAKNINMKNAAVYYWTFNSLDTVRNDTLIKRKLSKTGSFTFTLIDTNQCVGKDSILIDPVQPPKVDLGPFNPICRGDSFKITLAFPGPYQSRTIQWWLDSKPVGTDSFYIFKSTQIARLRVSVKDQYGCTETDSTLIGVVPNPVVKILSQTSYRITDFVVLKTDKLFATYKWFDNYTGAVDSFPASQLGSPGKYTVWCQVTDDYGCKAADTIDIFTDKPVSIGTNTFGKIKIYPNPGNTIFYVETIKDCDMVLCSIEGKTTINKLLTTGINEIDVSKLSPGLYIIRIDGMSYAWVKE